MVISLFCKQSTILLKLTNLLFYITICVDMNGRNEMKKMIFAALLAGFINMANAGFDEGLAAFNAGNFSLALKEFEPLAEQGDARAQYNLGVMYAKGWGVPQDDIQAAILYRKAAAQGDSAAQYDLGAIYKSGRGVPQDDTLALSWFHEAAEQGNLLAQSNLGAMYETGRGVPEDATQAETWFRKAAEQGLRRAQSNLGLIYATGNGVPQNWVVAYALFNLAASDALSGGAKYRGISIQNMTLEQIEAGQRLSTEIAKPKNLSKAIDAYLKTTQEAGFITKANAEFDEGLAAFNAGNFSLALTKFEPLAKQGNTDAQYHLGLMYEKGEGVIQDSAQSMDWYRNAADLGHAKAQFNLGVSYAKGRGVPRDDAQAAHWYLRAAELGDSEAQFNIGYRYSKGDGVPQDDVLALSWCRKAAEQGDINAKFYLGFMYYWGKGVPQDDALAVSWYRKAAEQGYAEAQYNLGQMYANGKGVRQNWVVAYALFNLAALETTSGGAEEMGVAKLKMTPKQIEAGQRLSAEIAKPNNLSKAIAAHLKKSL
jgi:TPR repeat protein